MTNWVNWVQTGVYSDISILHNFGVFTVRQQTYNMIIRNSSVYSHLQWQNYWVTELPIWEEIKSFKITFLPNVILLPKQCLPHAALLRQINRTSQRFSFWEVSTSTYEYLRVCIYVCSVHVHEKNVRIWLHQHERETSEENYFKTLYFVLKYETIKLPWFLYLGKLIFFF